MNDTISSGEELAGFATDLLDSEIQQVVAIVVRAQQKYANRANTAANLEMLRDEVLTDLAAVQILATVDPAPCFHGEPPVVEIIGKIDNPYFQGEFDHEQKSFEVRKATGRGEAYLGQKERVNTRKPTKK